MKEKVILRPGVDGKDAPWGGKGRALVRLMEAGFNVPEFFAVAPGAYPGPIGEELDRALKEIAPGGEKVAVRSSAGDEDGVEHSFAGQLESFLFVAHEDVAAAVEKVWKSGFSERVLAYRKERGIGGEGRAPTVLVQRMIDADAAGVAFSVDPVSGDKDVVVVSAVSGVGEKLVSGEVDGDTWHVRGGVIEKRSLAGERAVMGDEVVREVAELARMCGRYFARAQDVEWAVEGSSVYLLQSRAITAVGAKAEKIRSATENTEDTELPEARSEGIREEGMKVKVKEGAYQLWDNSNIAESYGGVTTPMTFSFARRAYDAVYREFCRMLGVSPVVIAANEEIFPRMLGLIEGRVYYNLLNWYRLLAMLPGYQFNRKFMEQMMGVREALPEEVSRQIAGAQGGKKVGRGQKVADALNLGYSILRIVGSHFTLGMQIKKFYRRLNEALGGGAQHLKGMRADELVAEYRGLEKKLLKRWDAPLLNDFFAMIFYGSLRKTAEKWCGEASLANDLLAGEGGMVSAEPAKRLVMMAELARRDEEFAELLRSGTREDVKRAIGARPGFAAEYEEYLEKFADRCLEELKLESPTLEDDPISLLRAVGNLASAEAGQHNPHGPATVRAVAELCVRERLRGKPVKRGVFGWVLRHARGRVRDRENLRFERTRIFGRVRRIVLELGERFVAAGVLGEARDVFYLELEEVLGFVEGTATTTDLRGLAEVRKGEFEKHRKSVGPPMRFVSRGVVNLREGREEGAAAKSEAGGEERHGIACCAGKVRGRVCVVRDPRGAELPQGRILVAERTDPGWIMLFPSASGILVERGSLLSHSAIVSRELGIPSIVSIPGLMGWLEDGDEVEMDGGTGVVRRVGKAGAE
jgi:pyruvate,water dikinase